MIPVSLANFHKVHLHYGLGITTSLYSLNDNEYIILAIRLMRFFHESLWRRN